MTGELTRYIISDGKLTLYLEREGNRGRYTVTSPFDPSLITEAATLEEAFEMAYDAAECLRLAREQLSETRKAAPKGKTKKSARTR